jgi:alpha-glucosidase (family GH31 glycosyl hydrolase)
MNSFLAVVLYATLCQAAVPGAVVSVNLGPPASHAPVAEADWDSAIVLDHFLRANGGTAPPTGTKAWVAWDEQNIYVRFRCVDPNPVNRSGARLKRTDTVDVYLRAPGVSLQDIWKFSISQAGEKTGTHAGQQQNDFQGGASHQDDVWTAQYTIPWSLVGGRPTRPFGMQLARLRYISDEVLSPSALDPHDGPAAADEFIETTLGGEPAVRTAAPGLVTLPSGVRRWEFPPRVDVLSVAGRKAIWNLQQQLSQATDARNFAERIRLAGAWYYLLMQEGLSFNPETGQFIALEGQLYPWKARQAINEALRNANEDAAYPVLDSLLKHFDAVSRGWFADESPGSVREDQWTQLDTLAKATVKDRQIELSGSAGKHSASLFVSFPALGGVRLSGSTRGFFDAAPAPFKSQKITQGLTASTGQFHVDIQLKPRWRISVKAQGQAGQGWELEQGDVAFRFSPDDKILAVDLGGNLEAHEAIYGFGEHFDQFNHRGHILNLWQEDAWDATVLGAPRNESYKVIPLWYSTRSYSVFWNSSYRMRADIGCMDADRYRLTVNGPVLDLFVWPMPPETALEAYTTLTGKPIMPPRWAFEPWAGGGGGRWGRSAAQVQIEVMKRFRDLDIPHSGLYAEGTGSDDPRLFAAMEPLGIHVFTWHRSQARNMEALLPSVPTNELPKMQWADGTPVGYPGGHPLAGHFPYIDFTHPRALEVTRLEWRRYFDLGVSGSMIDFGDLVPTGAVFHDGSRGDAMHNFYAYGYHRTVSKAFRERRGDDFVLFARGGAPGSQAFVENFAGDHPANFAGLKAALLGSMSAATAAFSNYGSDLGGYDGKGDEEVYLRWVEWAAFSPIMRAHGNQPREPWFYSDAAVDVYKRYAWVRENLVDYIDSAAFHAHETGIPIMQPLALAFPEEPALVDVDDEYMFGPDLLVAPMDTVGEQHDIILPGGRWTSFWDGSVFSGGVTRNARVRVDEIPVFLRAGALVPLALAPTLQLGDSMTPGHIGALLATPPQVAGKTRQWRRGLPAAEYASEPTATGFHVTLSAAPHVRFLIVAGMEQPPRKVLLGGRELVHLEGAQVAARPPGWYVTEDGRLIVRLPQELNQKIEISTL